MPRIVRGYRYQGSPLLSRERFRRLQVYFRLYAIAWAAGAIYVASFAPMSGLWRLAALIPLVIGTPALSDLVEQYDEYKRKWEQDNRLEERPPTCPGSPPG